MTALAPAPTAPNWISEIRGRGPVEIGLAFGLEHGAHGPGFLSPCPACGAEKRHPKRHDRRGAVGLTQDGGGWRCYECGKGGDAVALAALLSVQHVPAKGDPGWRDVRRACAAHGLCEPLPGDDQSTPNIARLPQPTPRAPEPPKRLPAGEVAEVWNACTSAETDAEVSAWLQGRGLQPEVISILDLARALPCDCAFPEWLRFKGRPWVSSSHRVIVPLYGTGGALESLHARALNQMMAASDKAAFPTGAAVGGLFMANPRALAMLSGQAPAALLIAEGVPDYLTWAVRYSEGDTAPAIIGVVAGSWSEALAARVPSGLTVYVQTHGDEAGAKYADRICSTLAKRCRVFRPPAPKGALNEAARC